MWRHIGPAFRIMIMMTVLFGFVYPAVVTGVCRLLFPRRAGGGLVYVDGRVEGSSLIGQNFDGARYFRPRPSAAGAGGYDAMDSGGSNLGPSSLALYDRVKASIARFRAENPEYRGRVPADLVTTSASGLDPDISPASAEAQARRVARARGISLSEVRRLIREYTSGRELGFLGERRVNVLEINLALDRFQTRK